MTPAVTPNPAQPDLAKILRDRNAQLKRMWSFRKQYDNRRAYFFRQYIGSRDQQMFPDNVTKRSNTFVPYPFSNVETIVSRVLDALFSYDPWFECRGRGAADDPAAEAMQKVLHYKLKRANFVPKFEEFVRNILIYGHAGFAVDWDWDYDLVPRMVPDLQMGPDGQPVMAPVQDPQTGQVVPQPIVVGQHMEMVPVPRSCPKFDAVDVFDLMVDPDGSAKARLTEKTLSQLKREQENYMNEKGEPLYFPEALAQLEQKLADEDDRDTIIIRIAEIFDGISKTSTILTFPDDASTAIALKDMRSAMRSGAVKSTFQRKVFGGTPILLWHGPNPFLHKQIPILDTSYVKVPGEVYGLGSIETISDMTESLNRMVNMITDNWNLNINKRYAYDLNADIDFNSLRNMNVPGGMVGVNGNPNDVVLPLPMMTPGANDYVIIELYKNMIEMTSGISDFYSKGVGSPTNNKTATGISQVLNESNYRFKMFIRNLEVDVLQPLLQMCATMVQQFVKDEEEVVVTDENPAIPKWQMVQPEDLVGAISFDLVAANYAQGKVIRQRNLMGLIQLIGQSPYLNEYEGLKELGKVFEIPNIQRLLKPPEQVQQEQQAAFQQQIQMMIFEKLLDTEAAARLQQSKPRPAGRGQGSGGGRPPTVNFGGRIKGAGLTSAIRGVAQSMGANALGLEGLGEIPGAS